MYLPGTKKVNMARLLIDLINIVNKLDKRLEELENVIKTKK